MSRAASRIPTSFSAPSSSSPPLAKTKSKQTAMAPPPPPSTTRSAARSPSSAPQPPAMRKQPTAPAKKPATPPTAARAATPTPPAAARTKSAAAASPLHAAAGAAKRKDSAAAALEKEYLVAALKAQVAHLEAQLAAAAGKKDGSGAECEAAVPGSVVHPVEPSSASTAPSTASASESLPSPSVRIAELEAKLKMQEILIEKLESKAAAFVSKDSAVAYLVQEKESNEARLDMIIKDKDLMIETMRRQIEMQVSGLFSEVSKSRELLVTQSETHAADLKRLNAMIASQAAELGQLREKMKEREEATEE
ncbi:hypothetical protein BDR26DRAFT_291785 [Obelidium mucronatum]|nr:hypothetical protein BDR26DRAFT_291785 [Obelidium mucronatum]